MEKHGEHVSSSKTDASSDDEGRAVAPVAQPKHTGAWADLNEDVSARPEGTWKNPAVFWWLTKRIIFRGVEKDVVSAQEKRNVLSGDVEEMHAAAAHYDNQAEYMYSFLQVMTAATSSFTHGANDVSNAIGPYATIYLIWQTNKVSSNVPVPDWILAFGGAAIVIGLWTYGYNIMRNLGNRITLHSPSRGFSMELGSAVVRRLQPSLLRSSLIRTDCRPCDQVEAPGLDYSVHHWCYRRRWSLRRYMEDHQLAYGTMDLRWLVHHPSLRWYHLWVLDGHHPERSSVG